MSNEKPGTHGAHRDPAGKNLFAENRDIEIGVRQEGVLAGVRVCLLRQTRQPLSNRRATRARGFLLASLKLHYERFLKKCGANCRRCRAARDAAILGMHRNVMGQ